MVRIADVIAVLERLAPPPLAEDWDNVGLLVGDRSSEASAVMTCLTLTSDVAREAIARRASLIVAHHPLLFRPVQRITADTAQGRTLLALTRAGVAVFSPHTSYDSAQEGINRQLAERLQLEDISTLRPKTLADEQSELQTGNDPVGAGRFGDLPSTMTLSRFIDHVKRRLGLAHLQYVGDSTATIKRVGVACGSAAEFIPDARRQGCHVLLTGEARFHACLEARAENMALVLIGHYASERPAMERLAELLARQFPELTVWASQAETDPLCWE